MMSSEVVGRRHAVRVPRSTWIIVCEHLHGAVGPVPTEELAIDLAAEASSMGECTYRPVLLAFPPGRGSDHVVSRPAAHRSATSGV